MKTWLRLAVSRNVVQRALFMALIIAPILVLINQGEYILGNNSGEFSWGKVVLTFLVPYAVSTVSSVNTLLQIDRNNDRE